MMPISRNKSREQNNSLQRSYPSIVYSGTPAISDYDAVLSSLEFPMDPSHSTSSVETLGKRNNPPMDKRIELEYLQVPQLAETLIIVTERR